VTGATGRRKRKKVPEAPARALDTIDFFFFFLFRPPVMDLNHPSTGFPFRFFFLRLSSSSWAGFLVGRLRVCVLTVRTRPRLRFFFLLYRAVDLSASVLMDRSADSPLHLHLHAAF
jgi:hypothetical protein